MSPRIGIALQDWSCRATVIGRASPVSMTACMAWQSHCQRIERGTGGPTHGRSSWVFLPNSEQFYLSMAWKVVRLMTIYSDYDYQRKTSKTCITHELLAGSDIPPRWLKKWPIHTVSSRMVQLSPWNMSISWGACLSRVVMDDPKTIEVKLHFKVIFKPFQL